MLNFVILKLKIQNFESKLVSPKIEKLKAKKTGHSNLGIL